MLSRKYLQIVITLCLFIYCHTTLKASKMIFQDKANGFVLEDVTRGLGVVWGMAFISKDEIIYTQRNGKAGLFNLKRNKHISLKNLPQVYYSGQGGLLDVAVPDDYAQSH